MDLVYCPFFMYCSFNVTIYYSKNMPFWFWQFLIIILCSLSVSFEVKSAKFALSFIDTKSILSCLLQFTYYSSILSSYYTSVLYFYNHMCSMYTMRLKLLTLQFDDNCFTFVTTFCHQVLVLVYLLIIIRTLGNSMYE